MRDALRQAALVALILTVATTGAAAAGVDEAGFQLGMRRGAPAAQELGAVPDTAPFGGATLEQRLAAEAFHAQTQQKSKWSDLSKTTRIWLIVGAAVVGLIIIAALD